MVGTSYPGDRPRLTVVIPAAAVPPLRANACPAPDIAHVRDLVKDESDAIIGRPDARLPSPPFPLLFPGRRSGAGNRVAVEPVLTKSRHRCG
ncbi:hypothetical protein FAIPA1_90153 [Frankia sp. AiPs1]